MRTTIPFLLALGACTHPEERTVSDFKSEALRSEAEGNWRKIDWQKDLKSALETARKETKPIVVVLVVGERGRKKAAEC